MGSEDKSHLDKGLGHSPAAGGSTLAPSALRPYTLSWPPEPRDATLLGAGPLQVRVVRGRPHWKSVARIQRDRALTQEGLTGSLTCEDRGHAWGRGHGGQAETGRMGLQAGSQKGQGTDPPQGLCEAPAPPAPRPGTCGCRTGRRGLCRCADSSQQPRGTDPICLPGPGKLHSGQRGWRPRLWPSPGQ